MNILDLDSYLNLNGDWNCKIYKSDGSIKYKGNIVVPYSPETVASGVLQQVKPDEVLEYNRTITIDDDFDKGRLKLNFGAVDQICELYINGEYVGRHIGGYLPFSFDITDYVDGNTFDVKLRVKDHTEKSELSRGKQSTHPWGIWYPAQSGIWQTVWMESVPEQHIRNVFIKPDVDNESVIVKVTSDKDAMCDVIIDNKKYRLRTNQAFRMKLNNPIFWEPENPYLYDVKIKLGEDEVKSYFGYRKIETKLVDGVPKCFLNNKPLVIKGILEQGYYKEGLYTPPSYQTIIDDINTIKECGFNTIRKHIKIEPALYYYYCDKMGMLVDQDMVNGGGKYNYFIICAPMVSKFHIKDDKYHLLSRTNKKANKIWEYETKKTLETLYNYPSIIMWTIFNESWGQYDSKRIYDMVKKVDSSRLIDATSGWYDQGVGKIKSDHHYYTKYKYNRDSKNRATLLSEFGGVSMGDDKALYIKVKDSKAYVKKLNDILDRDVRAHLDDGLIGSIYTQYNDIENEQNGIVNSDRKLKDEGLKGLFR